MIRAHSVVMLGTTKPEARSDGRDGLRQLGIPCQAADMRAITEAQMARDQYAREAHAAETKTRDWDTRYRSLVELLLEAIPEEALA